MKIILLVAKFRLGHIVITPNAQSQLTEADILAGIQRHQSGDWGELDAENTAANDRALINHTRILSAYQAKNGIRFWIITEADRSATTVMLPEDY